MAPAVRTKLDVEIDVLSIKTIVTPLKPAALLFAGLTKTALGVAENAVANVTVATEDDNVGKVPVVTVITPDVSVPDRETVGLVPAPAPAAMPGGDPLLIK